MESEAYELVDSREKQNIADEFDHPCSPGGGLLPQPAGNPRRRQGRQTNT